MLYQSSMKRFFFIQKKIYSCKFTHVLMLIMSVLCPGFRSRAWQYHFKAIWTRSGVRRAILLHTTGKGQPALEKMPEASFYITAHKISKNDDFGVSKVPPHHQSIYYIFTLRGGGGLCFTKTSVPFIILFFMLRSKTLLSTFSGVLAVLPISRVTTFTTCTVSMEGQYCQPKT